MDPWFKLKNIFNINNIKINYFLFWVAPVSVVMNESSVSQTRGPGPPGVSQRFSRWTTALTEIQFEIINKYVKLQMYINAYIYIKS